MSRRLVKKVPISRRPTSPCSGQANLRSPALHRAGLLLRGIRVPRKTRNSLGRQATRPSADGLTSLARSVGVMAGAVTATVANALNGSSAAESPKQQRSTKQQNAKKRRRSPAKRQTASRARTKGNVSGRTKSKRKTKSRMRQN
jgi:hypothetical protein